MEERSGYLEVGGRGVYSTVYLPAGSAKLAVAIVEPPAEEKRAACRMLVRLCRALAEQGIASIRFDLSGTGDSTCNHCDATFTMWKEDALAALDEVSSMSGCQRLGFVGARAGALIACSAALERTVSTIVLAEPLLDGGDYLNDLERRQSIKRMMSGGGDTRTSTELWAAGLGADFGGFEFSAALAQELTGVNVGECLGKLSDVSVKAIRVSASKKLPPAWSVFGENVELVADKPFWGQLDYYESDLVNDAIIAGLNGAIAD